MELIYVSGNEEIARRFVKVVHGRSWEVVWVRSATEAADLLNSLRVDAVVVGACLGEEESATLKKMCEQLKVKHIELYGGISGLLFNELQQAFPGDELNS